MKDHKNEKINNKKSENFEVLKQSKLSNGRQYLIGGLVVWEVDELKLSQVRDTPWNHAREGGQWKIKEAEADRKSPKISPERWFYARLGYKAWKMGWTYPRKIVFSAKMGLALTLISLLIFLKELVKELSRYSIWAILTVVVVFNFTYWMSCDRLRWS